MAKKNRKQPPKGKKTPQKKSPSKRSRSFDFSFIKKYWQEKSPVLRFILAFGACILLFYALYYSSFFTDYFKDAILSVQAIGGGALLQLFGQSVSVSSDVISGAGASVKIAGGCDGLEATALFLSAILVFPLPFKYKWPGLVFGFLALTVLNLIRIAGLYLVSVYYPNAFDFMHIQGGLYLYSIITVILMLVWADWALRNYKKDKAVAPS